MKIVILLLGHCLGDFILQSEKMAKLKTTDKKTLFKHCLIYAVSLSVCMAWFGSIVQILLFSLLIFVLHFLIDSARIYIEKKFSKKQTFLFFLSDQFLHILILIILSSFLPETNRLRDFLNLLFGVHIQSAGLFTYSLILLLYVVCLNPAGVFVKKVFLSLQYQNDDAGEKQKRSYFSGYVIGMLERVCVLTLTLLGQYAAISFVIAAKSLARIKQLENEEFAEKYLVGTLLSLIIALLLGVLMNLISGRIT